MTKEEFNEGTLFVQRSDFCCVIVGGEKWIPRPFGSRLGAPNAVHLIEQMNPEQIACLFDPRGDTAKADAVISICQEESAHLRAERHTVKD